MICSGTASMLGQSMLFSNGYENVERKYLEENNVENRSSKKKCRKNKYRRETCRKKFVEVFSVERKYLEDRKHRKSLDVLINRCELYDSIMEGTLPVRFQLISQSHWPNGFPNH